MFKKLISKVLVITMFSTLVVGLHQPKEVSAADITSGLVANWKFDGNATESVKGVSVETETNIKYEDGIFGKAAVFNGKSSYIETKFDETLLLRNNFTVSFWAYNNDTEGKNGTFLQIGKDCGWEFPGREEEYFSSPFKFTLRDGSNLNVRLSNYYYNNTDYEEGSDYLSTKHVDAEQWYLSTVTYDGKTVKLYRDSVLLGQLSYSNGTNINPYGVLIGANEEFSEYFKGKLDDLRFYKRALSYDDVKALYAAGVSKSKELLEPSKKLVAGYSFDGNMNDSSIYKNNANKVEVSGSIKYTQGVKGKAIELKKGNYIEIPAANQLNFDKELTISYWLRVDKQGSYPVLCRKNPAMGGDNANDDAYKISVEQWSGSYITTTLTSSLYSPDVWCPTGSFYISSNNEKTGRLDSWHHYSFTVEYDSNNDKLITKSYLNGKLNKKSDYSENVDISNASGSLLIGFDNNTFLTGAIDELQIYNYARSATQISAEAKSIDRIALSSSDEKAIQSMKVGKTVKISKATYTSINTGKSSTISISDSNLVIRSSNKNVIEVKKGALTAKKKGSANITVSYGGVSKIYKVTVK